MKITVQNTEQVVNLNGVPARLWVGETDSGIPVHCFVTRISPQTEDGDDITQFELELQETPPPKTPITAYPLNLIL